MNKLRFADDVVLMAENSKDLEKMINDLCRESKRMGLHINYDKTKLLTNGSRDLIEVDGHVVEYVEEIRYLGQMIGFENRFEREIQERINSSWKSYWRVGRWMKGDLPMSLKKKLFDSIILPTMTYGAQTWSLTADHGRKLQVCQRAMERSMLGITRKDRWRNRAIRELTKITDVMERAKNLKWSWAGHLARCRDDRWSRRITEWIPLDGKRRPGGQRKRWSDEISQECGRSWPRLARDRELWRRKWEALAQQWDIRG